MLSPFKQTFLAPGLVALLASLVVLVPQTAAAQPEEEGSPLEVLPDWFLEIPAARDAYYGVGVSDFREPTGMRVAIDEADASARRQLLEVIEVTIEQQLHRNASDDEDAEPIHETLRATTEASLAGTQITQRKIVRDPTNEDRFLVFSQARMSLDLVAESTAAEMARRIDRVRERADDAFEQLRELTRDEYDTPESEGEPPVPPARSANGIPEPEKSKSAGPSKGASDDSSSDSARENPFGMPDWMIEPIQDGAALFGAGMGRFDDFSHLQLGVNEADLHARLQIANTLEVEVQSETRLVQGEDGGRSDIVEVTSETTLSGAIITERKIVEYGEGYFVYSLARYDYDQVADSVSAEMHRRVEAVRERERQQPGVRERAEDAFAELRRLTQEETETEEEKEKEEEHQDRDAEPEHESEEPALVLPDWVIEAGDEAALFGTGVSAFEVPTMFQHAVDSASHAARSQLAGTIRTSVRSLVQDYLSEVMEEEMDVIEEIFAREVSEQVMDSLGIPQVRVVRTEALEHEPSGLNLVFSRVRMDADRVAEATAMELARRVDAVRDRGEEPFGQLREMLREKLRHHELAPPHPARDDVPDVAEAFRQARAEASQVVPAWARKNPTSEERLVSVGVSLKHEDSAERTARDQARQAAQRQLEEALRDTVRTATQRYLEQVVTAEEPLVEEGLVRDLVRSVVNTAIGEAELVTYERVRHEPNDADALFLKLALETGEVAKVLATEMRNRLEVVANRGEEAEDEIESVYREEVARLEPSSPEPYDEAASAVLDNALAAENEQDNSE